MPARATRPKSKTAALGADVPKLARIVVHVDNLDRGSQFCFADEKTLFTGDRANRK